MRGGARERRRRRRRKGERRRRRWRREGNIGNEDRGQTECVFRPFGTLGPTDLSPHLLSLQPLLRLLSRVLWSDDSRGARILPSSLCAPNPTSWAPWSGLRPTVPHSSVPCLALSQVWPVCYSLVGVGKELAPSPGWELPAGRVHALASRSPSPWGLPAGT